MEMLFTIIAGFVVLIFSYIITPFVSYIIRSYKERKQLLQLFPAEPHHWLYGHLHIYPGLNEDGLMYGVNLLNKYPRVNLFFIGPKTIVTLNHPETIKELTKAAEPKDLSVGGPYSLLKAWIGDGLLLSSDHKWFRNRKLLTPGFHFEILKPYMDVYNDCAEKMLDIIEVKSCESDKSINIYPPVSLCTLDAILRCAFSTKRNVQVSEDDAYVNNVLSLSKQVVYRGMNPILHFDLLYSMTSEGRKFQKSCTFSHGHAMEIIEQRKRHLGKSSDISDLAKHDKKYVDFLDILLLAKDSNGNGLTDQEILDEVETFMFEGHDTTASGLSWLLHNLAKRPEHQAMIYEELQGLTECRDNDRITWDDMNELPYLTRCIKESLRLHPPVIFVGRELTKPLVIDGKSIPAGASVQINIWNLHHNSAVWEDPMTYNPDRFLPENISKMDSYAFLAFSAGPRNCIGQHFAMNEMKTIIARIIQKFEFRLDTGKKVRVQPDIVLRAEHGIYLHFNKRH